VEALKRGETAFGCDGGFRMKEKRLSIGGIAMMFALGVLVLVPAKPGIAQDRSDNTKMNERDRNSSEATADQQKNSRSDRDLTQQIRQSITKDKSLSTYAHNVKIIAQNGAVTLKGPVRSEDEKRTVEAKATEVAGPSNVNSELTVEPENK
jgi:hyperosmotically inducible protein